MHIETQPKPSVCPMTVKKSCESLGRQRINSIQERFLQIHNDSIHNKILFDWINDSAFFKCIHRIH